MRRQPSPEYVWNVFPQNRLSFLSLTYLLFQILFLPYISYFCTCWSSNLWTKCFSAHSQSANIWTNLDMGYVCIKRDRNTMVYEVLNIRVRSLHQSRVNRSKWNLILSNIYHSLSTTWSVKWIMKIVVKAVSPARVFQTTSWMWKVVYKLSVRLLVLVELSSWFQFSVKRSLTWRRSESLSRVWLTAIRSLTQHGSSV